MSLYRNSYEFIGPSLSLFLLLLYNLFFSSQDEQPSPDALLSPPRMPEGAYQLALLQICNPLVKKCYGRGQLLKHVSVNDNRLTIPRAPHDLVIFSATKMQYWQNGVQKRGQLTNVYFHCMANCVRLMQPAFIPFLVYIPNALYSHLKQVHREHVVKELQIPLTLS